MELLAHNYVNMDNLLPISIQVKHSFCYKFKSQLDITFFMK